MTESEEHSNLVSLLHSYIADRFCRGDKYRVLTDSIARHSPARPPSIDGYIPDAYVMLDGSGKVIIGEAKSLADFENSHTEAQVIAFLKRCRLVQDSTLVLAVPWPIERLAETWVRSLRAREQLSQVQVTILSDVHDTPVLGTSGR